MTVKSSIWTVLPLTLLSGAAAAQDENPISFDFYGKANLSLQSNDEGDGSETELVSNASRIGVKGGTKLNDDFEGICLAILVDENISNPDTLPKD